MELDKSKVEQLVGESVSEFAVSAGCKAGDGMAGSLRSIHVKTTAGKDIHVVLKDIDKNSSGVTQTALENGTFKVENLVYSTLIPCLNEFAKNRGVHANLPVPYLYSAYKGDEILDDYLCMEDLRIQGFQMTDKFSGLTVDEMVMAIRELGKFHALTYAFIKWEGEKIFDGTFALLFKYFRYSKFDSTPNPQIPMFCSIIQQSLEIALEVLEKRNSTLHQRLKLHLKGTVGGAENPEVQIGSIANTDTKYFPVIIHGDAWLNNFLFKYNEHGKPIAIRFLDFQFTRRGNIYEDLMYTVYTSTTPDLRRRHLTQVLKEYYDTFSLMLKQLKIHLPIGFTFGSFVDTFNENIPFAYRHMAFAIPLQLGTSIPEVLAMMEKLNVQNAEGEPKEAVPMTQDEMLLPIMRMQMETSVKAVDRLETLTQEMVDLDIF